MGLTTNIGKRMRALREAAGRRQEDVAAAARACGLKWGRSTVAMLEAGQRRLEPEELLLLPTVLHIARVATIPLLDLLTEEGEMVELTPAARATREEVAKLLDPGATPWDSDMREWELPGVESVGQAMERVVRRSRDYWRVWPGASPADVEGAERDAAGEAEQKAAKRLGVPAAHIALAARRLWGAGLTAARDERVRRTAPPDASTETLRALRGHATREMVEELRPYLEEN